MYPQIAKGSNAKFATAQTPCHRASVPRKPRAQVKSRSPKVRMTFTDERLYRRAATAAGMDFSEFVRAALREKIDRMRADGVAF